MQVTSEDLRRQCAEEHSMFARCVAAVGVQHAEERCAAQKAVLEQCATATVQMVQAINRSCGTLYQSYTACCARARRASDCDRQAAQFYQCADAFSPQPLSAPPA